MNITEVVGKYKCDSGHEFEAGAVELVAKPSGFSAPMASFYMVSPDGTLLRGSPKEGDRMLACPVCHRVQAGGFDRID